MPLNLHRNAREAPPEVRVKNLCRAQITNHKFASVGFQSFFHPLSQSPHPAQEKASEKKGRNLWGNGRGGIPLLGMDRVQWCAE